MKSFSQSGEDLIVLRHWKTNFAHRCPNPCILSCGENNGTLFSNAKLLIENGFSAVLVEPSSEFYHMRDLHINNDNVFCHHVAIGHAPGKMTFYESENHVPGGNDRALVSSLDKNETGRWPDVKFTEKTVDVITFDMLRAQHQGQRFDIISLDCEAYDEIILSQINLNQVDCKILIIEWNGDQHLCNKFTTYCNSFGLYEIHRNTENLIFCKK